MERLPPYEGPSELSVSSHPSGGTNSTNHVCSLPTNDGSIEFAAQGVIGGSGVRLPVSARERLSLDQKICSRLRTFGPYVRSGVTPYAGVQPRSETFCPPEHIYQSAASQLDVLLLALSNSIIPSTTALRTITLRLDLPTPDVAWISESLRTGPVQGRENLLRAYKSWLAMFANKKLELGLLETAEAITGRVAFEGFLVLEEWWHPRRGLLMLTVRC
ncbi:hypothetical protein OPQ81_006081 [Rhizoctonia solani]|nr:hypothetical protein OPQ81_006081 [Rhizoctonia solani]